MDEKIHQAIFKFGMHLTPHVNGKTLADHSLSVGNLLATWGERESVVLAATFHSAYGRLNTKFNPPISLSERPEVARIIGQEPERLAYLNCAMSETSFWANFNLGEGEAYSIFDRFTKAWVLVNRQDLTDIFRINFANMIDHIDEKNRDTFKWSELSLYIQHSAYLSSTEKDVLNSEFTITSIRG